MVMEKSKEGSYDVVVFRSYGGETRSVMVLGLEGLAQGLGGDSGGRGSTNDVQLSSETRVNKWHYG
jgi:hypothetical protein